MDQSLLDTAMLRAHEVQILFRSTRPDGSPYYTANKLIKQESLSLEYEAEDALAMLMNPRASIHDINNILNKNYTSIGIGVAKAETGVNYYVLDFGSSLSAEAHASDYTNKTVSRKVNVKGSFLSQNATLMTPSGTILTGTSTDVTFIIYNQFRDETGFTFDNVKLVSSDPSIASVSGYTVTGLKRGSVTITAQLNGDPDATLPSTLSLIVDNPQNPWHHDNNGWWYQNGDGSYPANTWEQIDGKWYFFNAHGYMTTGWQYINNSWYFFDASGAMHTGWLDQNGTWYYLNGSGAMQTSWGFINNSWYYFNNQGQMLTGWQQINGKWCYFQASGAMVSSQWVGDYYLNSDGYMAVNTTTPDGYQVGSDGRWIQNN